MCPKWPSDLSPGSRPHRPPFPLPVYWVLVDGWPSLPLLELCGQRVAPVSECWTGPCGQAVVGAECANTPAGGASSMQRSPAARSHGVAGGHRGNTQPLRAPRNPQATAPTAGPQRHGGHGNKEANLQAHIPDMDLDTLPTMYLLMSTT